MIYLKTNNGALEILDLNRNHINPTKARPAAFYDHAFFEDFGAPYNLVKNVINE